MMSGGARDTEGDPAALTSQGDHIFEGRPGPPLVTGGARPRAALLGGGRMALAVARILDHVGVPVRMWMRDPDKRERMREALEATKVELSKRIDAAIDSAELIFIAVPAPAIDEVAALYGPYARPDHVVLHASRGVARGFRLPHQLIRAQTCVRKIGVLGGPLHATELATGRPLAVVLASRFSETMLLVQAMTAGSPVMLHECRDLIGVEIAGALSNVSAVAEGMSDALELGDTARGLLLTRGLMEARTIGVALGAEAATFTGLAGVGDLIPRKVSSTDRHRSVGAAIARGEPLAKVLLRVGGTVEGVLTSREAVATASKLGLEVPLIQTVDALLGGRGSPREALESLLRLDLDLDSQPGTSKRPYARGS